MLLKWRGPAWGELDVVALLVILSVSCITMVPLLNWSSTIGTAGRPDLQNCENNKRPKVIKKVDASARIILVFWSLLVIVGFMSAFIALQDRTPTSKCILVVRTYGERSLSVIIPLRLCYRRHYYDPLYLATLYIILTNKST